MRHFRLQYLRPYFPTSGARTVRARRSLRFWAAVPLSVFSNSRCTIWAKGVPDGGRIFARVGWGGGLGAAALLPTGFAYPLALSGLRGGGINAQESVYERRCRVDRLILKYDY